MQEYTATDEKKHIVKIQELLHHDNVIIQLSLYPLLYAVWERIIKRSINYLIANIDENKNDLYFKDLNGKLQDHVREILFGKDKDSNKDLINLEKLSLSEISLEILLNKKTPKFELNEIAVYYGIFMIDFNKKIKDQNFHVPIKQLYKSRNEIAHGDKLSITDESGNLEDIMDTLLKIIDIVAASINECCEKQTYLGNNVR